MFRALIGQRNRLAVFTAVILLVQGILPTIFSNVPTASAALSFTWEFNGADTNYTPDSALAAFNYNGTDSALHFKINDYSGTGLGTGLPAGAATKVMTASDGTIWMTMAAGTIYYSTDNGANWTLENNITFAGAVVTEVIEILPAWGGTGANLIAIGDSGGGNFFAAYSSNGGTSWGNGVGAVGLNNNGVGITYDAATSTAYYLTAGAMVESSTDGMMWSLVKSSIVAGDVSVPKDIVSYGNNKIAISGINSTPTGAVTYTPNGGTNWYQAALPGSPANISSLGVVGSRLYAENSNYLVNIDTSTGDLGTVGDWSNVSANVNGGTFSAGAFIFPGKNANVAFLGVQTGASYQLLSTLDAGGNWLSHYDTGAGTSVPSGGYTWNTTGTKLSWAGDDGANAKFQSGNVSLAATSALLDFSDAANVRSISASYHSLNYGSLKASFSDDGITFYYYDTGTSSWKYSTDDDSSKATLLTDLTGDAIWDGLHGQVNSVRHIKLYASATSTALIVDSLSITYDPVHGNGPDATSPSSQVNALPEYSTVDDVCTPTIRVAANASDDNSGVQQVSLYISTDGTNFTPWANVPPDLESPYEWDVPVKLYTTYYFYSIATDWSNNVEAPPSNNPIWDTKTTMDWESPWLDSSDPYANQGIDDTNFVGLNQVIELRFSEPMDTDPSYFIYSIYLAGDPRNPLTGLNVQWSNNNSVARISHPKFAYTTDYTVSVDGQDRAGNILNIRRFCPKDGTGQPPRPHAPEIFSFRTQPNMDPDIMDSTFEVANGNNVDGSYNAGDNAQYTVTLKNKSPYDATNVAVKVDIPDGLTYVKKDVDGGGRISLVRQNGRVVRWEWRNNTPIKQGQPVVIKFTLAINDPALYLSVTTQAKIYDNVTFTEQPDVPLLRSATVYIARNSDIFGTKIVNKTDAQPGDVLTYQISVGNRGTTVADIEISDYVPREDHEDAEPKFFYRPGADSLIYDHSLSWAVLPYYDSSAERIRGALENVPPNGQLLPQVISFQANIRADLSDSDYEVTNTAEIWDPNILPYDIKYLTATTRVPGTSTPDNTPLVISHQSPVSHSNNLKQSVQVGFNKSINVVDGVYSFEYEFYEDGYQYTPEELAAWNPTWSTYNGHDNAMFTLTPPTGALDIGAVYEFVVVSAMDTYGLELENQPVAWEFTTVYPELRIVQPAETLYELKVNTKSDRFAVTLFDNFYPMQKYTAEETTTVSLKAYLGGKERKSGSFSDASDKVLGDNATITIPAGSDTAYFYYRDSAVSTPNYVTIRVYDNPNKGWVDDEKYVQVVEGDQPIKRLVAEFPSTLLVNEMSNAITVTAEDENGRPATLTPGKLYFYSDSDTGAFYSAGGKRLPRLIVTQGGESAMPQYLTIGNNQMSASVKFSNSAVGNNVVTISDNFPQWPDLGFDDASAIISIQEEELEPEDLLKELEEVEDNTDRVIEKIKLVPTSTRLLPSKTQLFKATAYDTDGDVIENAKFSWFVLVGKSGKINLKGDTKATTQSTFTASNNIGIYSEAVMVATLYNGKVVYATADIQISDVVNYKGSRGLPITGMNGLQLILMGLTLAAAVALAWVEHYDKTHFKPED